MEANCVVCSVLRFFDSVNNLCLIGFFLNSRNQRTFGYSFLKFFRITEGEKSGTRQCTKDLFGFSKSCRAVSSDVRVVGGQDFG